MRTPNQAYAMLSIIFGILIIVFPDILSWLVGLYLIISGVLSFWR